MWTLDAAKANIANCVEYQSGKNDKNQDYDLRTVGLGHTYFPTLGMHCFVLVRCHAVTLSNNTVCGRASGRDEEGVTLRPCHYVQRVRFRGSRLVAFRSQWCDNRAGTEHARTNTKGSQCRRKDASRLAGRMLCCFLFAPHRRRRRAGRCDRTGYDMAPLLSACLLHHDPSATYPLPSWLCSCSDIACLSEH